MIALVDLPRPVHGMANINQEMVQKLVARGLDIKVINTVPSYASFLFPGKPWTVVKALHTIVCYLRFFIFSLFNVGGGVYRPINGSFGQVYDLAYLLLARLFFNKIYIHHHAFDYINRYKKLFFLLNFIAGKKAVHIVLGERMSKGLSERYNIDKKNIRIISNLAFFEQPIAAERKEFDGRVKLGYLANLSIQKGAESFINVCRVLQKKGVSFEAKIAGPFSDTLSEKIVRLALKEMDVVEYVGPLYGQDKVDFYKHLDCFVFPSKNEAEPLVLYEAALSGAYLAGTRYGCMQDMIENLLGYSTDDDERVSDSIAKAIVSGLDGDVFNIDDRALRVERLKNERSKSKELLSSFIKELSEL